MADFFKGNSNVDCGNTGDAALRGEWENVSKEELGELVEEYYWECLEPLYKRGYADLGGRGNSEAQSYGMLQSFFMDDKNTFQNLWDWTQKHLQREDNLFSWDYDLRNRFWLFTSKKAVIRDYNSATDADEDIALALLLAGEAWDEEGYIDEGKKILAGIWDNEVTEHDGSLYLLPGKWGVDDQQIVINTSYFSPAAYRIFARYDQEHDWVRLAADTYAVLEDIRSSVDRGEFNEFPPNWVVIDKNTGSMRQFPGKPDSYDYSYDAFRTLWRAGYDQLHTPNFESWNYVSSFGRLERDWNDDRVMCSMYHMRDGRLECDTTPTGLAGSIGVLAVTNGYIAEQIVGKYYIHDGKLKFPEESYYAKSWHWFAAYLFSKS